MPVPPKITGRAFAKDKLPNKPVGAEILPVMFALDAERFPFT